MGTAPLALAIFASADPVGSEARCRVGQGRLTMALRSALPQ